ncbi:hypothetical protein GCM10009625_00060 [Brachybacterium fresconis]
MRCRGRIGVPAGSEAGSGAVSGAGSVMVDKLTKPGPAHLRSRDHEWSCSLTGRTVRPEEHGRRDGLEILEQ